MDPILLFISIMLIVALTIVLVSTLKRQEPLANIHLRDLSYLGQEESLDRVVGSLSRVDDLLYGLSKRGHVILLADSLQAREEIVYGLVKALATSRNRELQGNKLLAVDIHDLTFGTKNSKALHEKFKLIHKQVLKSNKPSILYIDNIDELILTDSKKTKGHKYLQLLLKEKKIKVIGATNYSSYNHQLQELPLAEEFMVLPLESTD